MIQKVVSHQAIEQRIPEYFSVDHDDKHADMESCHDRNAGAVSFSERLPQGQGVLDVMKRDRFELLSAYLDGELSAADRRQVQQWLDHDPAVKQLYFRLLRLRQGIQNLPTPDPEQPVEEVISQIFARLGRIPRTALLWSGSAAAALVVSILMGTGQSVNPIFAQLLGTESGQSQSISSEQALEPAVEGPVALSDTSLQIALDQPIIDIPKATVSSSEF